MENESKRQRLQLEERIENGEEMNESIVFGEAASNDLFDYDFGTTDEVDGKGPAERGLSANSAKTLLVIKDKILESKRASFNEMTSDV